MNSRDELYPTSSGSPDLGSEPEAIGLGSHYFRMFPRLGEAVEAWSVYLEEWDRTGGVFSSDEYEAARDEITTLISGIIKDAEPDVEHYDLAFVLSIMTELTADNIRIQVAKIGEEQGGV
jgi:hypothetical protein